MFAQATGPSSLTSLGSVKSSVTVAMSNGTSAGSSPGQYVRARNQVSKRELRGKVYDERTIVIPL